MIDFAFPWDVVALAAALATLLGIFRLVTGGEPVDLSALFANPSHLPWPRGVQEEEPTAWRLELLDRKPMAVRPVRPAPHRTPKPGVAVDRC
jgi:hypothetical protein